MDVASCKRYYGRWLFLAAICVVVAGCARDQNYEWNSLLSDLTQLADDVRNLHAKGVRVDTIHSVHELLTREIAPGLPVSPTGGPEYDRSGNPFGWSVLKMATETDAFIYYTGPPIPSAQNIQRIPFVRVRLFAGGESICDIYDK